MARKNDWEMIDFVAIAFLVFSCIAMLCATAKIAGFKV